MFGLPEAGENKMTLLFSAIGAAAIVSDEQIPPITTFVLSIFINLLIEFTEYVLLHLPSSKTIFNLLPLIPPFSLISLTRIFR